jgi:hypothetical protein
MLNLLYFYSKFNSAHQDRTLDRDFFFAPRCMGWRFLCRLLPERQYETKSQPLILWVKLVVKYAGVEKLFNKFPMF